MRELADLWDWCLTPAGEPGEPDITLTAEPHGRGAGWPSHVVVTPWEDAAYAISRAVTQVALRKRIGGALLFHAAGLADADGRVLVCVGRSGAGKTTVARMLGRALGYVSDEVVAILGDGTIESYPKPLSVGAADNRHRKHEVSPETAGLRRPAPALRLGRVLLLARDAGREEPPCLDELDLLDAAALAAGQTSSLALLDAPLSRLAGALTTGGNPVCLRYREIGECGALVTDLLARPHPPTLRWTHHPPLRAALDSPPGSLGRGPYTDAIAAAGRVLVLAGGTTTILDGLGAVAWLAAATHVTEADIEHAAIREFGPDDLSASRVNDAVEQLLEAGLLQER